MNDRPLVTFALFAYNHEQFICEAVEGALSQTYFPLEIILSDDCSTDRTFALIQRIATTYQGPHKVIARQNERNLGLGEHINRVMGIAKGEFIVVAAGDDISLPERTEKIYGEFSTTNDKPMAVFSAMIVIDSAGNAFGISDNPPQPGFDNPVQCCRNMLEGITGASNAWHRSVFDVFGPLLPDVVFEDRVVALRAALLGGTSYIQEPFVKYRRHSTNTVGMFHDNDPAQMRRVLQCFLSAYRNCAVDLELFAKKNQPDISLIQQCRRITKRRIRKLESYLQIYSGESAQMIRGLLRLIVNGGNPVGGVRACLKMRRSNHCSTGHFV